MFGESGMVKNMIPMPVMAPKAVNGACLSNSLLIGFGVLCTLVLKICRISHNPRDFVNSYNSKDY